MMRIAFHPLDNSRREDHSRGCEPDLPFIDPRLAI
jgi:hypothetical protein